MRGKMIRTGIFAALMMVLLILDPKTAVDSAKSGIQMCIVSVIPSLFSFLVLSGMITSSFLGTKITLLDPIRKICGIPSGAESLLIVGLIGGYPVGAQCVHRAYSDGQISRMDAERMLGFCNNAGPAFIFGITAALFDSPAIAWIVWGIQIASALTVGILLPGKSGNACQMAANHNFNLSANLNQSVRTMGIICGWIVASKIVIGFLERWILWIAPVELKIAFGGFIELSNGCLGLYEISSQRLRFIFTSAFLAFGGLCVWLQTVSVTGDLSAKLCYKGKCLQALFSIAASALISLFLFPAERYTNKISIFTVIASAGIFTSILLFKKVVALRKKVLYNV